MTINKSQGQTIDFVGIWLHEPVFAHGKFYIAMSRVTSYKNLKIALPLKSGKMTKNIVYNEVLN